MPYRPSDADVAEILRLAPPDQPWRLEGPCRHRVRVILLETRWTRSWHRADLEARRLVARGRFVAGIRMPTGWDADTDLSSWIGSADCPVCDRRFILRSDVQIYCGSLCADRGQRIRRRQAVLPAGPTRCSRCETIIVDDYNGRAKFCSQRCSKLAFAARQREVVLTDRELQERRCPAPGCNNPVPVTDPRYVYCSVRCRTLVGNAKRDAKRQLNGNGHAANGHADPGVRDGGREDRPPARPDPPGGAPLAAAAAAAGGEATVS